MQHTCSGTQLGGTGCEGSTIAFILDLIPSQSLGCNNKKMLTQHLCSNTPTTARSARTSLLQTGPDLFTRALILQAINTLHEKGLAMQGYSLSGSATIPNHIKLLWESLLESTSHIDILASVIITFTIILVNLIIPIYYQSLNVTEQQHWPRFQKIMRVVEPLATGRYCYYINQITVLSKKFISVFPTNAISKS